MATTNRFEIIKSQQEGVREDRFGRGHSGLRTEWLVIKDGTFETSFDRKRDAAAFIAKQTGGAQ